MSLQTVNPTTGKVMETFEETAPEAAARKIETADRRFREWRRTDMPTRQAAMRKLADLLREDKTGYAELMAREMGKPIRDGQGEVEKCAWACEHFAEHAAEMLAPEAIDTDAGKSYIAYQPLGVILAIMPWNYPFWQVFRFAAPTMMAGNAVVLKHASNVPGCALAIEALFRSAGFPDGLFSAVMVRGRDAEALIEHPSVRGVTLTGSGAAGRKTAAKAGDALKKSVLELGGSDPAVILEDADLDLAAEACTASRLLNSGQSCISAKRFIAHASILKDFAARFTAEMARKKLGDPQNPDTEIGPQARADLRENLHRQVRESVDMGAECLLGGELPEGDGFFYPSTVITGVRKGMPVFDEETFGPAAAIVSADSEDEAIRIANDTSFGLGASVFTRDVDRGERIAALELEAGNCFVNAFVKSDPRLPFGGVKESGFGRELARHGILEFVNVKTVYVR